MHVQSRRRDLNRCIRLNLNLPAGVERDHGAVGVGQHDLSAAVIQKQFVPAAGAQRDLRGPIGVVKLEQAAGPRLDQALVVGGVRRFRQTLFAIPAGAEN